VQGRVSLLRSLHCFLIIVAIKILLLRSLNAFCCGSAALCLCGECCSEYFHHGDTENHSVNETGLV
jgi:hypothetical protein